MNRLILNFAEPRAVHHGMPRDRGYLVGAHGILPRWDPTSSPDITRDFPWNPVESRGTIRRFHATPRTPAVYHGFPRIPARCSWHLALLSRDPVVKSSMEYLTKALRDPPRQFPRDLFPWEAKSARARVPRECAVCIYSKCACTLKT